MSATENDFSFFNEDDGGLLVSEGWIDRKLPGAQGLMTGGQEDREWDVVGEVGG